MITTRALVKKNIISGNTLKEKTNKNVHNFEEKWDIDFAPMYELLL